MAGVETHTSRSGLWSILLCEHPIDGVYLEPATLALYRRGKSRRATELPGDARTQYCRAPLAAFFQKCELLFSPTLSQLLPMIGRYNENQEDLDASDWMHRVFEHTLFTALTNVIGASAMSVLLAQNSVSGLPLGLHNSWTRPANGAIQAWLVR